MPGQPGPTTSVLIAVARLVRHEDETVALVAVGLPFAGRNRLHTAGGYE